MNRRIYIATGFFIFLMLIGLSQSATAQSALKGKSGPQSRDYWPTSDWKVTTPEKQGMDDNWLGLLRLRIPEKLPHIRSVLVVRHGYIVLEEYFQGSKQEDLQQIASITKSITSILVGIAVKDGSIKNLNKPVEKYFSEFTDTNRAPQFKEITIKHLLTMTAGFDWSDDNFSQFIGSPNQTQFTTLLPITNKPGEKFNYNTPAAHLLSFIITKMTGKRELEFANEQLFKPLGISNCEWPADSQGLNLGGNGAAMRTRDMAKLGYLYLNNGRWGGKQIVAADWVKESIKQQSEGGFPEGERYGYLWWVTNLKGHPAYFAGGYGGQFIYVIPDLDIVVVITSNLDKPHMDNRGIIGEFILPAVEK
jgi:CubicO group peptidase (beta-lactamase class C family)